MSDWFGKGCAHQTAYQQGADTAGKPMLVLAHCNHLGNISMDEDNCSSEMCPLKIGTVEHIPAPLPAGFDLGDAIACLPKSEVPTLAPAVKPPPTYAVDACRKALNFMIYGGHCDGMRASEMKAHLTAVFSQAVVDIVIADAEHQAG